MVRALLPILALALNLVCGVDGLFLVCQHEDGKVQLELAETADHHNCQKDEHDCHEHSDCEHEEHSEVAIDPGLGGCGSCTDSPLTLSRVIRATPVKQTNVNSDFVAPAAARIDFPYSIIVAVAQVMQCDCGPPAVALAQINSVVIRC